MTTTTNGNGETETMYATTQLIDKMCNASVRHEQALQSMREAIKREANAKHSLAVATYELDAAREDLIDAREAIDAALSEIKELDAQWAQANTCAHCNWPADQGHAAGCPRFAIDEDTNDDLAYRRARCETCQHRYAQHQTTGGCLALVDTSAGMLKCSCLEADTPSARNLAMARLERRALAGDDQAMDALHEQTGGAH